MLDDIIAALSKDMPNALRWAGAVAKRLREYNVALEGKSSGNANTDALTLADLSVQELLVAVLRDSDPVLQNCAIDGEEETGDMSRFPDEAEYTIGLDPIDGTKQYRDRSGNGWAVMLTLRSVETIHYSLVYVPATGEEGTWVEVSGDRVTVGLDDHSRPAREVLDSLPVMTNENRPDSNKIYLIGFQERDPDCAQAVTDTGLHGFAPDNMPGSIYPLLASGEFGGSLIHSPNIYDYPVSLHLARILGGDSVWVHNGERVNFGELWMDDRADMLRLPGVVATSPNRKYLARLCELAKDWPKERYID